MEIGAYLQTLSFFRLHLKREAPAAGYGIARDILLHELAVFSQGDDGFHRRRIRHRFDFAALEIDDESLPVLFIAAADARR